MKQASFAGLAFDAKKKTTKRDKFLAEMNKVVPWSRLQALIEPRYPKAGNGRPPLTMLLRVYCLQQWYGLSDPGMEEALYDMESMRRFVGIELSDERSRTRRASSIFGVCWSPASWRRRSLPRSWNIWKSTNCCCAKTRSWAPLSSRRRLRAETRSTNFAGKHRAGVYQSLQHHVVRHQHLSSSEKFVV